MKGNFWGQLHQVCVRLRLEHKAQLSDSLVITTVKTLGYYPLSYHADLLAIKDFGAETQAGIG